VNFWAALGQAERSAVRAAGSTGELPSGTVILHEGSGTTDVALLLAGWAKVTTRHVDGYESLLAARGPGDIVGEMAALLPMPRTAEVRALSACRIVRIQRSSFEALLRDQPNIALALLRVLVARLRHADRWRARCGSLTVDRRVEILLAELLGQHGESTGGTDLPLPFSQEELAGFVAGSRKSVCRALRRLRTEGLIATGRRQITVLRPDVLAHRV
jgi:CRP/FNR family transcriptional regulator, cyclic AMP receptor protein